MKIHTQIFQTFAILAFTLIASGSVIAQDWIEDEDLVPARKGFEFGLNFGVYQANHDAAQLYSGAPKDPEAFRSDDELTSLENYFSLGNSQVELLSIPGYFARYYSQQQNVQDMFNWSESVEVFSYPIPQEIRYDPAMMFGIKGTYFFNAENSLFFDVNAVSLRASGGYSLLDHNNFTNVDQALEYGVFAKERRYISSLGYRTSLYINDYATWIFGFGGSATTVEIVSNSFNVENMEFQLIVPIGPVVGGNPSNANRNIRNLSNTGFGFFGFIGLEGIFEKGGNLEASFRVSRDRIKLGRADDTGEPGLTGYDKVNWNFSLYITWMIPPHIGDFVRASF